MRLRLHHFLPHSRANGPGLRAVIWVQGCSLGCPGCFNPQTHSIHGGEDADADNLFQRIAALGDSIEGITVSGGEPLQQRLALTELLRRVNSETKLSVILFTGYRWDEVMRMGVAERQSAVALASRSMESTDDASAVKLGKRFHAPTFSRADAQTPAHSPTHLPTYPAFLNYVDILITGRYDQTQRLARGLRGSANKTVHFLTNRYTAEDLESVPVAEIVITPQGKLLLSGIEPLNW